MCDPIDGSPPGSTVPVILQARTLEWVAISFSNARHSVKSESVVAQLCPILRDPMDCSLPGSSVHGIFQARVLEWGAVAFSGTKLQPPYFPLFSLALLPPLPILSHAKCAFIKPALLKSCKAPSCCEVRFLRTHLHLFSVAALITHNKGI